VKTRLAKNAQNCFLNCRLPKEVVSTIDSHIDEIEMEVLHASWTSEFSHKPRPEPDIEPRHRLELSYDPLSFAALALVADLFMLRPTAMWLINLSQRLRGTAGCAKPAE